jgi:hypothetical protein
VTLFATSFICSASSLPNDFSPPVESTGLTQDDKTVNNHAPDIRGWVEILMRFQRYASDLRQVTATMRFSSNVERFIYIPVLVVDLLTFPNVRTEPASRHCSPVRNRIVA